MRPTYFVAAIAAALLASRAHAQEVVTYLPDKTTRFTQVMTFASLVERFEGDSGPAAACLTVRAYDVWNRNGTRDRSVRLAFSLQEAGDGKPKPTGGMSFPASKMDRAIARFQEALLIARGGKADPPLYRGTKVVLDTSRWIAVERSARGDEQFWSLHTVQETLFASASREKQETLCAQMQRAARWLKQPKDPNRIEAGPMKKAPPPVYPRPGF